MRHGIGRLGALIVAVVVLVLTTGAAPAAAAGAANSCAQIGVSPSPAGPPPGFRVTARQAVRIARGTASARAHANARAVVVQVCEHWVVSLAEDGRLEALVDVDGRSGRVQAAFEGYQARWPTSRGSSGLFVGQGLPLLLLLLLLALVFVAPFIDLRRPRRAVHVDLAAMLAVGVSLVFFRHGNLDVSTPLVFAGLGFLLVRMLQLVRRPGDRADVLAPWASPRLLLAAAAVLTAGRELYNALVGHASDVGYYSVFGAQSFLDGFPVYAETSHALAAYGPATHMAYVPFTALFPLPHGLLRGTDEAAHAAAISFDVLTVLALYALGRRLRGHALGAVLAFAWAANPLSFYPMAGSTNDGLVALLVVLALLALESPPGRGVFVALAAAAKWVPALLIPLFAGGPRRIDRRAGLFFVGGAVAAVGAVTLPILPDGGVREIYNVSIGDLAQLDSPFSIWGLWGLPDWLRLGALALVCLFAVATAWVPERRNAATVAALATAILVAGQMTLPHWVYAYAAWFLPAAMVASFARHERPTA